MADFVTEQRPLEEILLFGEQIDWDAVEKYMKAYHPTIDLKLTGPFPALVAIDAAKAESVLSS
ncbi:hypothetical protein LTR27_009831 [Elasticomyces elasticus]|nr:hypothetical protein LTR27_009831 [Elasticomyces elasticus]